MGDKAEKEPMTALAKYHHCSRQVLSSCYGYYLFFLNSVRNIVYIYP